MTDIFDMSAAFDPLKEAVAVLQPRGERIIRTTAKAVISVGSGLSTAAGAQVSTMLADRVSVVADFNDWESSESPEFGDVIECESFGRLTVQQVTRGPHEWTTRCTKIARGGLPS